MPRKSRRPDFFDQVRQIDIAWLRRKGYLRPNQLLENGSVSWLDGRSVSLDIDTVRKYVKLTHWLGEIKVTQVVFLESVPSNLGKGLVWYFNCPLTDKRCRKLYEINGRFRSRHECPEAMYCSQAEPKRDRGLRRFISLHGTFKNPKAEWNFQDGKHYRMFYQGKPTKRWLQYQERSGKIDNLIELGKWREAFFSPTEDQLSLLR